MRDHSKIVRDRGATALVHDLADKGLSVHQTTPQRWADRNSIPSEYWPVLVEIGAASLEELIAAQPKRQRPVRAA